MRARETTYKGHLFRSGLEARWAAFFDLLGWPWVYEPFELAGYIPDFILQFKSPLLVEVKPALDLEELRLHTGKIERSGWQGGALIVGADWGIEWPEVEVRVLGLRSQAPRGHTRRWSQTEWIGNDPWFRCAHGHAYLLDGRWDDVADRGFCWCAVCGTEEGPVARDVLMARLWGEAHRLTRWTPKRPEARP